MPAPMMAMGLELGLVGGGMWGEGGVGNEGGGRA